MPLQLDDLAALDAPMAPGEGSGQPLMISVDLIDEDPEQPRHEFDPETLRELADTIALRGVRQPISVRPHPDHPGRWMINFGARRLRASRLAGKTEIPAFVDAAADSYDQVIENEQREALRPLDLALFVRKELLRGLSQVDVARRLGKSAPYINYVCALIDAPDWLMNAYREGKCRGIKELYDLRRLHERHPTEVLTWIGEREVVSRTDIAALRERCEAGAMKDVCPLSAPSTVGSAVRPSQKGDSASEPSRQVNSASAFVFHADLDGRPVRLIVDDLPAVPDAVFVLIGDNADRQAIALRHLRAIRLARGEYTSQNKPV